MSLVRLRCSVCGKWFEKPLGEYNRRIKKGATKFMCSKRCGVVQSNRTSPRKGNPENLIAGNKHDEYTRFRAFAARIRGKERISKPDVLSDVTAEYLAELWDEQGGKCPLTGWGIELPLSTKGFREKRSPRNASVGMIDSLKLYTQGNVRFVSLIANLSHGWWDDEVVFDFCNAVSGRNDCLPFEFKSSDDHDGFMWFTKIIRYRSNKSNIESDVTMDYLKGLWEQQGGMCPITGWNMDLPLDTRGFRHSKAPGNASLDRIDSSKWYVRGNVRFTSLIANLTKADWGDEEVFKFCNAVADNCKDQAGSIPAESSR